MRNEKSPVASGGKGEGICFPDNTKKSALEQSRLDRIAAALDRYLRKQRGGRR